MRRAVEDRPRRPQQTIGALQPRKRIVAQRLELPRTLRRHILLELLGVGHLREAGKERVLPLRLLLL